MIAYFFVLLCSFVIRIIGAESSVFEYNLALWKTCHKHWLNPLLHLKSEESVNLATCIPKDGFSHGICVNESFPRDAVDCELTFADPFFDSHKLRDMSSFGEKPVICTPPDKAISTLNRYTSIPYEISPLLLHITAKGKSATKCLNLANAKVKVWHSDKSVENYEKIDAESLPGCTGWASTNRDGNAGFITHFPPVIGPPQHVFASISLEGFHSLTTALYFSNDAWLQFITGYNVDSKNSPANVVLRDHRVIQVSPTLEDLFVSENASCSAEVDFTPWDSLNYDSIMAGLKNLPTGALMKALYSLELKKKKKEIDDEDMNTLSCLMNQTDFKWLKKARIGHIDLVLQEDREELLSSMDCFWKTPNGLVHSQILSAYDLLRYSGERSVPLMSVTEEESDQFTEVIHFLSDPQLAYLDSRDDVVAMLSEYPLPREWGTMVGKLKGWKIEEVVYPALLGADLEFLTTMNLHHEGNINDDVRVSDNAEVIGAKSILWDNGETWEAIQDYSQLNMRYLRLSFAKTLCSNVVGTSIPIELQKSGCLDITEIVFLSGQGMSPTAIRNKYEGRDYFLDPFTNLLYYSHPSLKSTGMNTPQFSQNNIQGLDELHHTTIRCSNNEASLFPCWKSFDGVLSLNNRWSIGYRELSSNVAEKWSYFMSTVASNDGGEYTVNSGGPNDFLSSSSYQEKSVRNKLVGSDDLMPMLTSIQPVWIEIDFGKGHGIIPTGLAIYCGQGVLSGVDLNKPTGCPRDFTLYGSNDGKRYYKIYRKDQLTLEDFNIHSSMSDDTKSLNASAIVVHFLKDSRAARQDGMQCGSCETHPQFSCFKNSTDLTCNSGWCNERGLCEAKKKWESRNLECNGGRYGLNCAEICPMGYHCPRGALLPLPCLEKRNYCPQSSSKPIAASSGYYTKSITVEERNEPMIIYTSQSLCPLGMFCLNGEAFNCPTGFFGAVVGLNTNTCSGSCPTGTYCLAGTVIPIICPAGSFCESGKYPVPCPAGRYGGKDGLQSSQCTGFCDVGHYCPPNSTDRKQVACPAGRFGASLGLTDEECSGICPEGYFCPEGSSKAEKCGGSNVYCPKQSGTPTIVSNGWYSIGGRLDTNRNSQIICERGSFCAKGVKYPCIAGRFGNETGLEQNPDYPGCSSACLKGHYCPTSTIVPIPCPTGRYGSDYSLTNSNCSGACSYGHYCPLASVSSVERKCPAGRFGGSLGLKSPGCSKECDGPVCKESACDAGFFCHEGSTSPQQEVCGGPHVYCPSGSSHPTPVQPGFYTIRPPNTLISQEIGGIHESLIRVRETQCEPGHYCTEGKRYLCPAGSYGSMFNLATKECSGLCSNGSYCMMGSTYSAEKLCPAGRYGAVKGLTDALCSGECQPGYFCPAGSISPTELPCNSSNRFCPPATGSPIAVKIGWSSLGGNWTTRSEQTICDIGSYCKDGIQRPCPAGRYGSTQGLSLEGCSGPCYPGYYCHSMSITPDQDACPRGTYGPHEGLRSVKDCLPCPDPAKCGEASVLQDGSIPAKEM